MSKTIWIINQYAGSIHHGKEYRSAFIAKELVSLGYKVFIITSTHSHLFDNFPDVNSKYSIETIQGVSYIWIRTKQYTQSKGIKRLLSMLSFIKDIYFMPHNLLEKPDTILISSPSPFPILNGIQLKKKYQAKLIFEVRDLWPLSIIELGNFSPKHPLIYLLSWLEKLAYAKSDKIVSVLPCAKDYMISRGMKEDKFIYIPNGVQYNINTIKSKISHDILLTEKSNTFIIGYAGAFGLANDLYTLLKVAKDMKENTEISFILVGSGPEKDRIQQYIKNHELNNVSILNPVARTEVHSIMKKFDVCYIGLQNQALFKYGVSPNKLFDYMMAARPILYAIQSGNHPVQDAKCGIEVEPENPLAIREAILKLYSMNSAELEEMGENGEKFVIKNHNYKNLTQKYTEII